MRPSHIALLIESIRDGERAISEEHFAVQSLANCCRQIPEKPHLVCMHIPRHGSLEVMSL